MRNLILALLLLSSCRYVNPKLESQVTLFESYLGHPIDFAVNLSEIDHNYAGICYSYTDGNKQVIINSYYWDKFGPYGKEELMFHELGHCALNKEHDSNLINGLPESIMYPVVFGDTPYYAQNRDYYINQLFK